MEAKPSTLTPEDLSQAKQTAEGFLSSVIKGDESAARAVLIVGEGGNLDFASMHDSIASYSLGEPTADGEQAIVVTTVTAKPGKEGPPELPMVLRRVDGKWMVDMAASINRMLGVDLNQVMNELVEGMGHAMKAMGEGLAEGMKAVGEGMAAAMSGEAPALTQSQESLAAPAEEAAARSSTEAAPSKRPASSKKAGGRRKKGL